MDLSETEEEVLFLISMLKVPLKDKGNSKDTLTGKKKLLNIDARQFK